MTKWVCCNLATHPKTVSRITFILEISHIYAFHDNNDTISNCASVTRILYPRMTATYLNIPFRAIIRMLPTAIPEVIWNEHVGL
jgi:hypothetical protein